MTVRFEADDLALFAAASHDRNPLHLSPAYARKTQFGQQVVYGMLGVLACWPALRIPRDHRLASLRVELSRPIFAGVDYQVVTADGVVHLMDGSTQMLKLEVGFTPGEEAPPELNSVVSPPLAEADAPDDSVLRPGLVKEGQYRIDSGSAAALFSRFDIQRPSLALILLLWSSYLTGMVLPGERAVYSRLYLEFAESVPPRGTLGWRAKVLSRNQLNQLRSGLAISLEEVSVAAGYIEAFVRPVPLPSAEIIVQSQDLAGTTALVIGASRGLGAAITRALALRGARVLANYQHSRPEAEQLARSLAVAPGEVLLCQGDASSPEWNQSLRDQYGEIDFLVLNACPTVLRMWVEPMVVERINNYVAQGFALVSVPLAAFAGCVKRWSVLISSIYVETTPREFPQYIALKGAVEGLFRTAAQQYPHSGYLIVRPPKLLTDMTNTPYGTRNAMAPETIASLLTDRLIDPHRTPGMAELLR